MSMFRSELWGWFQSILPAGPLECITRDNTSRGNSNLRPDKQQTLTLIHQGIVIVAILLATTAFRMHQMGQLATNDIITP